MGAELDMEETTPSVCACASCLQRARVDELVARAGVTRLTSIRSIQPACRDPWTVYIVQAERVCASGRGASEEEALHEALRTLGVVS